MNEFNEQSSSEGDITRPPDPTGVANSAAVRAQTVVEYSSRSAMGRGYIGKTQTPKKTNFVHPDGTTSRVWRDTVPVGEGVNRIVTTVVWDPATGRWKVVQHFPHATEMTFDAATKAYKSSSVDASI